MINVQIALMKLEPDWWLELENTYIERVKQRQDLYLQHDTDILQTLSGAELATKELMEMCLQFLCARYPMHFHLSSDKRTFHNNLLHTITNLKTTDPMIVLLNNVPEDFVIMLRDPKTGIHNFRAGMICSSLGWSLGSKMGMALHEIHELIPEYKEKMQFSMDRYFTRLSTDKPIQRGSWGLEIDEPLYMPPGASYEQERGRQDPALTIDRCRFRVDWQTLRRLPLSGAVVFNFKGLFTPISHFRDEPFVPSLLLKVIREGNRKIIEYKNTWHTEHVVIPALEEYERWQIATGLIPADWDAHTLAESPFFPGWKKL